MSNNLWLVFTCIWLWCCMIQCHQDSWPSFPMLKDRGSSAAVSSAYEDDVCLDVDIRNSVSSFSKLENCSVVEGSVQILLIDNAESKDFENMTFPKLKEITGYLLLYRVQGLQSLSKLFPNLTVIRGDVLFHNYALVIYELRAILDVGLTSLTTILRGSVRIEKNAHLCYVDTIDWDLIAKAGRNGHFIKDNKAHEQCPNTCPEMDCHVSSSSKTHRQQKLCWNSHACQKVCGVDCEYQNLTCSTKHQCCHQECLGGCNGQLADECIACRHVVYNRKCMKQCPPNTFKYLGRRCIEENKCKKTRNKLSISHDTQDIYWKPFQGQCLPQCPQGYSESKTNKHECKKCKGQCPKICDGAVIDSVSSAQKLKDCTYVNGSLEIQIQGGDNIIKELESSLSSIKEIRGYLKIARSYPLVSLNFLRDLAYIHGEQLDKKEYALLVLDNQNLQELWNWESRKNKLMIKGGKVFFHFNSKLCPNKIEELKSHAEVMPWDERDVSPSSNGDRVACNVIDMDMEVWRVGANVVGLRWTNFRLAHKNIDFRSLLGYVVYFKEAPDGLGNVTIFDGRDACGADEWKIDDVDANEDPTVITLLTHLKPFTRYAAYMRTYTIASAAVGAQTPIIYFQTKPATPTSPVNLKAHASSPNEIVVTWFPPKNPNGVIKYYIVEGIREKDSSEFVSQRNYCNEPLVISDLKKPVQEKIPVTEDPLKFDEKQKEEETKPKDCCSCSKKNIPTQGEETESQIQFEDFLHNKVYLKNPSFNANAGINTDLNQNLPSTTRAPASKMPFFYNITPNSNVDFTMTTNTELTSEEPSTTASPDREGRFYFKVEEMYRAVTGLHHFTEYTIEVKACQEKSRELEQPCSSQAITTVRTLPLGGADDIEESSIIINNENLTAGIYVKWDEPKDYNGLIVNYHVEIRSSDASDYKTIPICITQLDYQKKMGYIFNDLLPGNYSLRLRATSLAGNGNWTRAVYFIVPDFRSGMRPEFLALLVIGIVFVVVSTFGAILFYAYQKKKYDNMPTMLYASVNPEYMSAVYEPDEWEVPRDKIALLQELGQGSFGMVYKGEFTTEDRGLMKCAVKTVNETASLRERIEFLQEASVMKAFNCHHVVRLLGVVSKGHPTLVVMELMGKGDLKAYLRSRRPDSEENVGKNVTPPTLKEILKMAVEIADGMAYLAAKKFVHRDLAARNCMVSDDLTCKIGDFGMTRDIYETDYYRKGGKGLLPVRWMAPECLKDGLFSSQSDIWSYGVVLWEMSTLASQPYQGLANEQVLHYVISGGKMSKPENCPDKLYALMELCWDKNPKARPTFLELIDMVLPDVDQGRFKEVSFYSSQRQETSTKESESESATASTPMRTQWMEAQNSHEESDTESEITFFPPTRNTSRLVGRNSQGDSRAYSVHSIEGSKGVSATSSDDSKGSKVSSTSNGSIANGGVPYVSCRTTVC
ncbi:insulin-like peptide receptor isoform X2 [Parasteatoda tepidariorum]|uniref:insulin-like peptide receptor isoform X2 n=1 Tax=Parasteatoda tepidariorum TaxID=114398 RepID=UPI00077FC90A|nr:insulin-like peptide receptor isoform X2 [Parasteatoda tepidariorum]